jgi:hypothetical protein
MRDAAKIAREVRTPAEAYADTVAKLDSYLAKGLLTQDVYSRAIAKSRAEMDAATKSSNGQSSSLSRYARIAAGTERVVNGLSGAIQGIGSATKSVADAGQSVIAFAADIAKATAAWQVYKAVTNTVKSPTGLLSIALGIGQTITVVRVAQAAMGALGLEVDGVADFAVKATLGFGAFKAATAVGLSTASVAAFAGRMNETLGITNTLRLVLTRVGVSAATTTSAFSALGAAGAVAGGMISRLAIMSIPGFGQLAASAYLSVKAMMASRDAAYSAAAGVASMANEARLLGVTLQDLNVQKALDAGTARQDIARLGVAMSEVDAAAFDNLAFAAEEMSAATTNSGIALDSLGRTVAGTFTGLFAGVSSGSAALTESFASIVGGINSIASPIAAVLRPFGTVFGTIAEAAMKGVAIVGEFVGISLRLAGAIAQVALSPFIVGLNNVADAIRSGVGSAFEWLGGIVDGINARIDAVFKKLQSLPVIGKAFASNAGGVVAAAKNASEAIPAAGENATSKESVANIREEESAIKSLTDAIGREEQSISRAIEASSEFGAAGFDAAVAYQEQLRALERQLDAGILNETSFANAAAAARKQFEGQIEAIRGRNAADEKARKDAEAAAAAAAAEAAARASVSTQSLKATDSRSKEGMAEMFRLMRSNGEGVQEQQLGVLEQIRDAVSEGDDMEAFGILGA